MGAKAYVKAKVLFIEKLSGYAIAKLLYKGSLGTENKIIMQIINNTPSTMYLSPEESIGIVNLDLKLEEHFATVTTQNVRYQKREVVRKPPDLYPWLD